MKWILSVGLLVVIVAGVSVRDGYLTGLHDSDHERIAQLEREVHALGIALSKCSQPKYARREL